MTKPGNVVAYYCDHSDEPYGQGTHVDEYQRKGKNRNSTGTQQALSFGVYSRTEKIRKPPPCPRAQPLVVREPMDEKWCLGAGSTPSETRPYKGASGDQVLAECDACHRILKALPNGRLRKHQPQGPTTRSHDRTMRRLWDYLTGGQ